MASDELTIAEAAERTGLTRHTLRYYERDGLMLGVGRAGSGHRRYSERDLGWIELITKLRATGMPIREVRRYAELVRRSTAARLSSSCPAEDAPMSGTTGSSPPISQASTTWFAVAPVSFATWSRARSRARVPGWS
jgi:DNA-binding transcriptional MerR regulator